MWCRSDERARSCSRLLVTHIPWFLLHHIRAKGTTEPVGLGETATESVYRPLLRFRESEGSDRRAGAETIGSNLGAADADEDRRLLDG